MHQLQNALDGDLDPVIDPLVANEHEQRLKDATDVDAAGERRDS